MSRAAGATWAIMGGVGEWSAEAYGRVNTLQQWLAGRALGHLELRGDERVLDVGCGDGTVTAAVLERLPRGSVVGIDPSTSMVEAARRRVAAPDRARFEVGDAAALTYDADFDVVVSFNALHWVLGWREALTGVRRALRPGGRALLLLVCDGERPSVEDVAMAVTQRRRWRQPFAGFAAPYVHVDPETYAAAAEATGFAVDQLVVDDLRWDFGSPQAFTDWCRNGFVAWTARLPDQDVQPFVDDVVDAYAAVTGSRQEFAFLQLRAGLTAAAP